MKGDIGEISEFCTDDQGFWCDLYLCVWWFCAGDMGTDTHFFM
jgi:hypothetical protein